MKAGCKSAARGPCPLRARQEVRLRPRSLTVRRQRARLGRVLRMAQAPLLTVILARLVRRLSEDGQHRGTPITRPTRDLDTTSQARNGMSSRAPWSRLPSAAGRPAGIGGPHEWLGNSDDTVCARL